MKKIIGVAMTLLLTIVIFINIWKLMGLFWNAFVPWNQLTDLIALVVVTPLLIGISYFLAELSIHHLKKA